MYTLWTFGEQRCSRGDGSAVDLSPLLYLLLVYLGLQERQVSRADLARVFWPKSTSKRARHSLSQAVYALGQRLPQLDLQADATFIRPPIVDIDVHRLRKAAARQEWPAVLGIYRGTFLRELAYDFTPELDYWREEVDAVARTSWAIALAYGASDAERAGAWAEVESYSRTLVECNRASPSTYSQLAHSLVAQGRIHEATAVITDAASVCGSTWAAVEVETINRVGPREERTPDEDGRFIGRATEFATLRTHWDRARGARASLVLLHGEAGIGKTRLARQVGKLAAIQGGRLLQSRCFEAGHRVSYAPVSAIAAGLPDSLAASLPERSRRLISVIANGTSHDETQAYDPDMQDRDGLIIHTFLQAISKLASQWPVLVFVDDCQWIDTATADLLVYLADRLRDSRLLILCAARSDLVPSNGLRSIESASHERIRVQELTPAEGESLARQFINNTGTGLSDHQLARRLTLAGGNPFFLLELLGATKHPAGGTDRVEIPNTIESLLQRKYLGLSDGARWVAAGAAVLDRTATTSLLRKLAGLGQDQMLLIVAELVRAGFVRDAEVRTVNLKHDLIRETVLTIVPTRMRRLLHARAAKLLRRKSAPSALVAYHADLAGLRQSAWQSALRAGDEAVRLSAHADAIHWYEVACRNARPGPQRHTACSRILHYALSKGAPEQAEPYVAELLPAYLQNKDELGLVRCEHVRLVTEALSKTRAAPHIASSMLKGAEIAERLNDANLAVRVYRDLASILQHNSTPEELLSVVGRMISCAEQHEVASLAQVYAFAAFAFTTWGSRHEALELAERGVAMAAESNDIVDAISAYASRGCVKAANGLLHDAVVDYRAALRAADESGVFLRRSVVEVNYGATLMELGLYPEAEECLTSARGIGERENPFATANLAVLCYETGRLDRAAELATLCGEFGIKLRSIWLSAEADALSGLVALARGDRVAAELAYDRLAEDRDACIAMSTDPTHVIALSARVLANRGRATAANEMLLASLGTLERRSVLVNKKIELEQARLLMDSRPDSSFRLAQDVASMAKNCGANPLFVQAKALLEEIQLRR